MPTETLGSELLLPLQDQNACARLQMRLLHLLCQAAEKQMDHATTTELPPMQADHEFHPATKTLGISNTHAPALL